MCKALPHSNSRERRQLHFLHKHSRCCYWLLKSLQKLNPQDKSLQDNPDWLSGKEKITAQAEENEEDLAQLIAQHWSHWRRLEMAEMNRANQGSILWAPPTPNSQRRQHWWQLFNTQQWESHTVRVTHLWWPNHHNIRWITLQKYRKHHLGARREVAMSNARICSVDKWYKGRSRNVLISEFFLHLDSKSVFLFLNLFFNCIVLYKEISRYYFWVNILGRIFQKELQAFRIFFLVITYSW